MKIGNRKLKRVEVIILIGFINSALVFIGLWIWYKAPDRDIYVPSHYSGWVKIKHSVSGAPPVQVENGVQKIVVSDSGYYETSTRLEIGWRRDRFFWTGDQNVEIPKIIEADQDIFRHILNQQQLSVFHEKIIRDLEPGKDTFLLDGTKIEKKVNGAVNYEPGRKSVEYVYISAEPLPLSFTTPPIDDEEVLSTTEDRILKK